MKSNKSNGQLTAQVDLGKHDKSGFDLSCNVLGTGKIGRIIPTRALHVMPGDTIKQDSKVAVQFEPLAVPILANMEVRQEHFYVPYNIVWKNWDKFISGGEKNDYQGVVPNVSMRRIFDVLTSILPLNFRILKKENATNDYEYYMDTPQSYTTLQQYVQMLDTVGSTYYIKDLFQAQYEVLKQFETLEPTMYRLNGANVAPTYGGKPYFFYTAVGVSSVPRDALRGIYDAYFLSGNKYMEECFDFILDLAQNNGVVLPTAEGCAFLNLFYEFYKNFMGYGSNIDYLNMNRLSLTEFYATVIDYLSMEEAQGHFGQGTTSTTLDDVDFNLHLMSHFIVDTPMSILHLRANYNIWYNNYRDILLEADAQEPVDDDVVTDVELFTLLIPRQRCWEKDAFTTALDNPGTGNVGVPIGVNGLNYKSFKQDLSDGNNYATLDGNNVYQVELDGNSWDIPSAFLTGINPQESTELDSTPGFSLYQLDAAQRAQKFIQKILYYGNRINDFYLLRFGVRYLDARLRLPELLTSSSELVKIDVVMNNTNITTEANGQTYQSIAGDRAGYASAYDNGNSFDRFCEEHGVIMSFMTIMPQVTYAYGMSRDYSRLDQFDFAFPEFATLGMDAVYDSEISNTCKLVTGVDRSLVFGYQGKYYDYKAKHSEEHGELLDTQDMYTFARKFNMLSIDGRPKLNYEFVHCFPDLDMFVVDSPLADYFRYDIRHSTAAERELPVHSIYI